MAVPRLLRQISSWRVPPNWSPRDWLEELSAELVAAASEAERDFDPTRGVPWRPSSTSALGTGRAPPSARMGLCQTLLAAGRDQRSQQRDRQSVFNHGGLRVLVELSQSIARRRAANSSLASSGTSGRRSNAQMLSLSQSAVSRRKRHPQGASAIGWTGRKTKKSNYQKNKVINRPPSCILKCVGKLRTITRRVLCARIACAFVLRC